MDVSRIASAKTMQLATVHGDQPWICTVYFVLYAGRFYWLSFPSRRHSQEMADNSKAAVAIPLQTDKPVVGIQAEGSVSIVDDLVEIEPVIEAYVAKYGQGGQFIKRFKAGENKHALYCFTPQSVMLFDEQDHADDPYQEISVR